MPSNQDHDAPVFLHPQTKIEPTVGGWYAWAHLIAPAQRAMNIVFRHIPLLESFVRTPALHASAAKDPALFGGPFVDLAPDRVEEVKALLHETLTACAPLIDFAKAYKAFDLQVQRGASGGSLMEFYPQLPAALGGLVELLYDLNHHPRLRLYEELLYSELYNADSFAIQLSTVQDRERTFFMSTPRLPAVGAMSLRMSFADARIDALAELRTRPAPLQTIAARLNLAPDERERFQQFCCSEAPERNAPDYADTAVRVRYFGHACVLVQGNGVSVLIDPVVAGAADDDNRFTFADLPDRIDYLILSHAHQDHCAPEWLLQLRHRVARVLVPANNSGSLADPSMKLLLEHLGFTQIDVLNPFDTVTLPGGTITSIPFPGEHADLDIHSRQGIHVELLGRRFIFLVDSDFRDPALCARIAQRLGARGVDALFVGMECHGAPLTWLYGPLLTKQIARRDDESRRLSGMSAARAQQALASFRPARVFVYAMGQEPWLKYMMGLEYTADSIQLKEVAALGEYCRGAGLPFEHLHTRYEVEI